MSLYLPTRTEIDRAVETAAALALALWSRLVYAGCILRAGDLLWAGGGWTCRSATDPTIHYAVDFAGCPCPDCQGRHAELQGDAYCSHRLALLLYCDICLAHLRRRLLGATADPVARAAGRLAPNAGVLLLRYDARRKLALVVDDGRRPLPLPICQLVRVDGKVGFAAERDLAAFATWLAQARRLPAPVATLLEEATPGTSRPARIPPALAVQVATLALV